MEVNRFVRLIHNCIMVEEITLCFQEGKSIKRLLNLGFIMETCWLFKKPFGLKWVYREGNVVLEHEKHN